MTSEEIFEFVLELQQLLLDQVDKMSMGSVIDVVLADRVMRSNENQHFDSYVITIVFKCDWSEIVKAASIYVIKNVHSASPDIAGIFSFNDICICFDESNWPWPSNINTIEEFSLFIISNLHKVHAKAYVAIP